MKMKKIGISLLIIKVPIRKIPDPITGTIAETLLNLIKVSRIGPEFVKDWL